MIKTRLTRSTSDQISFQVVLFVAVGFENLLDIVRHFTDHALIHIVEPSFRFVVGIFSKLIQESHVEGRSVVVNLFGEQICVNLGAWERMLGELEDDAVRFDDYHRLDESRSSFVGKSALRTFRI